MTSITAPITMSLMATRCCSAGFAPHCPPSTHVPQTSAFFPMLLLLLGPANTDQLLCKLAAITILYAVFHTGLFPCPPQEHKDIPYIVAELGLVKEGDVLTWGLDPKNGVRMSTSALYEHSPADLQWLRGVMQEDDNTNFTAVWVFTPSEKKFEVFQEFEVVPDNDSNSVDGSFTVQPPQAGYKTVVWGTQFEPDRWSRRSSNYEVHVKAGLLFIAHFVHVDYATVHDQRHMPEVVAPDTFAECWLTSV